MIERRLVTQALETLLTAATGKPCGTGALPQVAGKPAEPPYCVLRSLTLTLDGAPFTDRHEDSVTRYQVDCVARSHTQAEWLADRARTAVLGRDVRGAWLHALTVPGRTCYARGLDLDAGTDPDAAAAVVTYILQFRLDWTQAA
ncbi:hypothetical protein [Streptomyces javensis]|uniref:DUF3168 domain-containing protein n=1 Tax=Streptomyces javensis TaxID=114698 RepID=A0ABS0R6I3_9ACTN|nr:hypothetical protein [Streptomyces javensis]MBI0313016.1 hypothetical protein [Streptomyces javensis]